VTQRDDIVLPAWPPPRRTGIPAVGRDVARSCRSGGSGCAAVDEAL